ncbi:hypothetical protein CR513_13891, partial [Mucuna pruriens]
MVIREKADQEPPPVISLDEKDMRYKPLRHDEPMSADMEPYVGKLYGFAGEQVEIRGGIELETTFGERSYAHTIPVLCTIVDVEASYNVIMERPALNKLGTVVSTYHLCMKYPVGKEVGRVWADHRVARRSYEDSLRIGSRLARADRPDVNVLDLDLDPICDEECERPLPAKDLKEITIGTSLVHKMKIGTILMREEESNLISFLQENRGVFVWSPANMLGIDIEFICHRLSISSGFRPIAQRRRKLGEEKRRATREEAPHRRFHL